MKKIYINRIALAAGIVAMVATGAQAGSWRNINSKMTAPSFVKGWSGNFSQVKEGVAENYNGAFEAYQVLSDVPAGKYTLTCNAFYRYATADLSKANMANGANHNAYIYLGTAQKVVEGIYDNDANAEMNGLADANAAFAAGKYANSVEFDHPGGDLRFGIVNKGGQYDEWTAFDNFKVSGPNGDLTVVNGDFADVDPAGINWETLNVDGSSKLADIPLVTVQTKEDKQNEYNGKVTGVWRKSNASVYNWGTPVELEAGKYRFGVQSFFRCAGGNQAGKYVTIKGGWEMKEGKTAWDAHVDGSDAEQNWAYIYATDCNDGENTKPGSATDAKDLDPDCFYNTQKVKCIFDETLEVYPDNEPKAAEVEEGQMGWVDSGFEQEAAKCFINNPDLYRNYVEFELPAKATVWVGVAIDARPDVDGNREYWHPGRDFTLEMWDENSGVGSIANDNDAPAVYYNLQGIRVMNPENGIFIVKKGNETKKVLVK